MPLSSLPRLYVAIFTVYFSMYGSAVLNQPAAIGTWGDLLENKFSKEMPHVDITNRSPDSYPVITPYPASISRNMQLFCSQLQTWLEKYGSSVNNDLFDGCEQVSSSGFAMLCSSLEQVSSFHPPSFPKEYSFAKAFRFNETQCLDYGRKLSSLIKAVESAHVAPISEFEDMYWRNEIFPIGYARRPNDLA